MKKIQLLNLAIERNIFGLEDRWQLPLNFLWLGTYLQMCGYEVEILDTTITPLADILTNIDASLLGISFFGLSAHLLESVTAVAKERGCYVVCGGQAATPLARQILKNDRNVDSVVCGDGEEAVLSIAKMIIDGEGSIDKIPNLAYRHDGEIVFTEEKQIDLLSLPIPNRRLPGINIEKYISNFLPTNTDLWSEDLRATNAYVKKGCPRRVAGRGCSFCARIDQGIRSKTALQAYREYKYLTEEFGINYIYDDSDSWVDGPWLREMSKLYETIGGLNCRLRVYADLKDFNKENVTLMKTLGVDAVLIGIESGDERVSRVNGKPVSPNRVKEVAKLLGSADIKLWDAYVLGLIGETKSSIMKTRELAFELRNYCKKENTYWSVIQPLPGSRIWSEMMKISSFNIKYNSQHVINMEEVQIDFVDKFCHLGSGGYQYLKFICKEFQLCEHLPFRNYIR